MSSFLGVHVGRGSLRACLLACDGLPVARREKRFEQLSQLPQALRVALLELSENPAWSSLRGACIALDKAQRGSLMGANFEALMPAGTPLVTMPAHLAILLGAVPTGPSLLVSLGSELRLAAIDSTNTFREFRLQEGGGQWWTAELSKLAPHSEKLTRALSALPTRVKVMKALPQLLEMADFPAPDPVLKIRVDGLCDTIAERCLGLSTRFPGVRTLSFAGFLHPGPLSRRISEALSGAMRVEKARFPAEVGAALMGLSLHKENEERRHLGKPPESGQSPPDRWAAPPLLVRRLFRMRRPFERFTEPAAR